MNERIAKKSKIIRDISELLVKLADEIEDEEIDTFYEILEQKHNQEIIDYYESE
jgi:uncharacterized protein (DUF433 family)